MIKDEKGNSLDIGGFSVEMENNFMMDFT